jgi:enoyl-CoA hydratase/carnithine racemase
MSIETVHDGRLLRIILNRPEKRNALNVKTCREVVEALRHADENPAIGATLLSGAGKAFCAGMDLTEARDIDRQTLAEAQEPLFTFGDHVRKPVIAAVQGPAIAGGTALVANAHIAIASDDATFGLTEIRLGLWPVLIFPSITGAVGERRALELSLTGRVFKAAEAQEYGLVHEVVPRERLEARAMEIALGVADSSSPVILAGLQYVRAIRGKNVGEAMQIGRKVRDEIMQTEDFAEGLRAFAERRPPVWPSRSPERL